MTERRPIDENINHNDLTNQPNLFRLEREGDIFMPEQGAGEEITREEIEDATGQVAQRQAETPINPSSEARAIDARSYLSRLGLGDRENEELLRGGLDEIRETRGEINKSIDKIKSAEDISKAREGLEDFFRYVRFTKGIASDNEYEEYEAEMQRLSSLDSKEAVISGLDSLSKEIKKHYAEATPEAPDVPESLEDLAALIMRTGAEEWRTGHDHQLINENGELVKENFLRWVRSRIYAIHDFNPTSEVNFFSEVNVITKSGYRTISLSEMIFTPSFFLEKKKENVIYGYDENGNPKTKPTTTFHKNEDYEALKDQLVKETFLFMASRNNHVQYVSKMGREKEIAELISEMYKTSLFTRGNFLETILTLPSAEKGALTKVKATESEQEKNSKVGNAVRKALLSYYYIYDYKMLTKILGEDAVLFKKSYQDIDGTTGKIKGPPKTGEKNSGYNAAWFEGEKLKLQEGGLPPQKFMEYLNVFLGPNTDERIAKEVRERIVQSLMKSGLDYEEARYAETWAFSMTRWSGLAARNDTRAIGFDAWTKVQNTMYYRLRQAAGERNAMSGNPFNLGGFKRLGLNFFEGITTSDKKTVLEKIQGGEGSDINLEKAIANEENPLVFNSNAMQQFAVNHIQNGFGMLEFLIDYNELNFQNFTSRDSLGRVVIDYEKANKVIGGIEKAIRYAYSTWAGTAYDKKIRTWEGVDENLKAKEMPIASMLFGPDILKYMKLEIDRIEKEKGEIKTINDEHKVWNIPEVGEIDFSKLQEHEMRRVLWKSVFKYAITKEIESHRNIHSPLKRFDFATLEKIYGYLETQQNEAFDKDDIGDIRGQTKTSVRRMFAMEGSAAVLGGGVKGFLKSLGGAIAQLSK